MEPYTLPTNIKILYLEAPSFEAIEATWQKLYNLLPVAGPRKYYGISGCNRDGSMYYYAGAEEAQPGEAEQLACKTFIIPKGEYVAQLIHNFMWDIPAVGRTFQELLKHPRLEANSVCVEIYEKQVDVWCLVKLAD